MRADIQGMRAVAVLVVIASHARLQAFAGGYVGVDVFFVISGFLITGLLLREVERPHVGRALLTFYARRARRILPAATVVLVATCAASALFLAPVRAGEIFTDAWWAALFAANLRFAYVETDYFASDRPLSPLQHYWSLSVEEQFYLVWPLLLMLVAVLAVRRRRDPWRGLAVALGVLVAASLAWSVWATHASPDTAYFSSLTRAWELGIGALVAVALARRATAPTLPDPAAPTARVQLAAGVGAVLVAVGVLGFDERTPVPGFLVAVPVLGAAALLLAGALPGGQRTWVGRGLALRPMQVLGDWSYSLYLWHFPVLVIARSYWGGLTTPRLLVCLAAILVLSGLTYRFVEEPFRRGRRLERRGLAVALYPAAVAVLAVGVLGSQGWVDHKLARNDGNPAVSAAEFEDADLDQDPTLALVQASVLAAQEGQGIPGDLVPGLVDIRSDTAPLGDCDYRTGTRELCPTGDAAASRTIVVVGDSHARAWSPAVTAMGEELGYRTYSFVYTGCPANQAIRLDPETGRDWPACADFVDWTLDQVAQLEPDLVLVANAPLSPIVDPDSGEVVSKVEDPDGYGEVVDRGLEQELERLGEHAGRVVVLGNTPKLPREQAVCLSSAADLGDCLMQPLRGPRRIQQGFAKVAEKAGADYLDAEQWFCTDKECPAVIGRFIPMRDSEHMTTEYAEHIADSVAAALGLTDTGKG